MSACRELGKRTCREKNVCNVSDDQFSIEGKTMSIAIHFIDGQSCPFFLCDVCGDRILEPRKAMCAWLEGDERSQEGNHIEPIHVHKGRCLDAYEANETSQRRLMTEELVTHVAYLVSNSSIGPDRIERALRDSVHMP
jgi:hypothetical protein